jgi:hypothetical protein
MGDLPMGDLPVVLVWPVLTSLLLGLAAPRLVRALPPAPTVRLLAAGALICAASTTLILALTAWLLLAEIPVVAVLARWSAPEVLLQQPVPDVMEALAGVAWVVVIGRVTAATLCFTRSMLACQRTCRKLGGSPADLVIIESARPEAYAVADGLAGTGRIVVSTGLMAALSPAERRVVFAHEAAHLHGRHHVWRALVDVAVAANPLLTTISGAVHYGTERWADEDAAREVSDRRLAARALARAALAAGRSAPAMGFGGYRVSERVESLLRPPPPRRHLITVLTGVLAAVTLAAATDAQHDTGYFLDQTASAVPPKGTAQTGAAADHGQGAGCSSPTGGMEGGETPRIARATASGCRPASVLHSAVPPATVHLPLRGTAGRPGPQRHAQHAIRGLPGGPRRCDHQPGRLRNTGSRRRHHGIAARIPPRLQEHPR